MTISPWGLSKEYRGSFIAEMSGLPLHVLVVRMMKVGLLLSTILTLKFLMILLSIMMMIMMRMMPALIQD